MKVQEVEFKIYFCVALHFTNVFPGRNHNDARLNNFDVCGTCRCVSIY